MRRIMLIAGLALAVAVLAGFGIAGWRRGWDSNPRPR